MTADRLREAARVLRERAEGATPGPWSAYVSEYPDLGGDVADVTTRGCSCDYSCNRTDPRYIATMHPGVGLALADWLDLVGAWRDEGLGIMEYRAYMPRGNLADAWLDIERQANVLADLILGGAS